MITMKKGTTRRVFLFKKFIIKIAIISWIEALISFKRNILSELWWLKKYRTNYFRAKRYENERVKKDDIEFALEKSKRIDLQVLPSKWYEGHSTTSNYLFGGIMANHQESFLYKSTRNPFLMPTYASLLFGLVNIQKRGKEITFWNGDDINIYLALNSQSVSQVYCDGHALKKIANFVIDDDNHIKISDYGSRQVEPFIILNGENLYNNFKLPE